MNIDILAENINDILGKRYNVEYQMGNEKYATFNNTLVHVDGVYYWFFNKKDGFACLRKDRVNFMYCTDVTKY